MTLNLTDTLPAITGGLAIEIDMELARAREKHAPVHSLHEAKAVIEEELDEFWDAVKAWRGATATSHHDPRHELVQVAAMAIRAIQDLRL